MNKLEQAARQALEALEVYGEHAKDCPQYPTYTRPQDYPKCDCGFDQAITALREALAEQEEQEPVGRWNWNEAKFEWLTKFDYHKHHMTPLYAAPQPLKQESVAIDELARACNLAGIEYKDFLRIKAHLPIAAPVRTKDPCNPLQDLTDDEIEMIFKSHIGKQYDDFARAVIAAYKEKNK